MDNNNHEIPIFKDGFAGDRRFFKGFLVKMGTNFYDSTGKICKR